MVLGLGSMVDDEKAQGSFLGFSAEVVAKGLIWKADRCGFQFGPIGFH